MKSRWKTYLLYAGLIIIGGGFIYLINETIQAKNTGFETKTLWDWMELLIIPLVLASGAFYLNRSERVTEREIARDRQQEVILQGYIDRMAELLLKEKLLTTEKPEVRDVARTLTASVMPALDTKRNGLVVQFLRAAKLILGKDSILDGLNLDGVDLHGLNLANIPMVRTSLQGANLSGANLSGTNLYEAILNQANLYRADLRSTNLSRAQLVFAKLQRAHLSGTKLDSANLQRADLRNAHLFQASLTSAHLGFANLRKARFLNANLKDAIVSDRQLATTKSLEGTTMPDGTIHE